jgi:hypothetical protein
MAQDRGELKYVARLPTIRSQIYSLVWACALPAILGFALLTNNFVVRERTTIEQDTLITARALIQAVDRDLHTGITVAMALANSPSIDTGDFAAFYRQATEVLRPEFPGYNFVLHDQASVQLLNTGRPYGTIYPDPISAPRIAEVFRTGKPLISNLFHAGALQRPLAAIHVPVLRDGKVIYVVSVAFVPERLGQVLREQRLPANRVAAIFDANGVFVARTHDPEKYVGRPVSSDLLARYRLRAEDAIEATTVEGIPVFSMYSRSAQSGWSVVIGVPRTDVYLEMLDSIKWIMAFLAVLTAAGFGVAWHFARSIERSVRALATMAMTLGGKPREDSTAPATFLEAAQALETLQTVESELLRYRHHLENLIEHRTRQLESAMREAQAANAAKDVFVANMSHELRTPMNAVLGVAHLLGGTGVSPEQARYLDMIRTSGQSLLGILNDIREGGAAPGAVPARRRAARGSHHHERERRRQGPGTGHRRGAGRAACAGGRRAAAAAGAGQFDRQCHQVHGTRRDSAARGAAACARRRHRAAVCRARHRHRLERRADGAAVFAVHPGRLVHHPPVRRHRAGTDDFQGTGRIDARFDRGAQRAGRGQRISLYRAARRQRRRNGAGAGPGAPAAGRR